MLEHSIYDQCEFNILFLCQVRNKGVQVLLEVFACICRMSWAQRRVSLHMSQLRKNRCRARMYSIYVV